MIRPLARAVRLNLSEEWIWKTRFPQVASSPGPRTTPKSASSPVGPKSPGKTRAAFPGPNPSANDHLRFRFANASTSANCRSSSSDRYRSSFRRRLTDRFPATPPVRLPDPTTGRQSEHPGRHPDRRGSRRTVGRVRPDSPATTETGSNRLLGCGE